MFKDFYLAGEKTIRLLFVFIRERFEIALSCLLVIELEAIEHKIKVYLIMYKVVALGAFVESGRCWGS